MSEEKHKKPTGDRAVIPGQRTLPTLEELMGYEELVLDDPRHEVFAREYAAHFNGARAYAAAFPGTAYGSCRSSAPRLLADATVRARIEEIQRERLRRLEVDKLEVVREVVNIALANVREMFCPQTGRLLGIRDMDPDVTATISQFEVGANGLKVKTHSKLDALKLLMQYEGLLVERQEVQHGMAPGVDDELQRLDRLRAQFAQVLTGGD